MIKKVLFLLPVISFLTFFTSCEDSLKLLPPNGLVKDEYWETKEDVKATLMGAYKTFANLDSRLFYFGELRADMLKEDRNLGYSLRNIMESNIQPSNYLTNWQDFYSVINYCNTVLKYSPQVKKTDDTFTDYQFRAYRAEAVFLRSLAYFYLVRVYKDVPFVLKPYDSDDQNFFPSKTKSGVILDSLETQLNRVRNYIPETYETRDLTKGRATRGAVNALLADIALWKFDYEACINYVENIQQSNLYELLPPGKWFNIFSEGNTLEGIFEFQFDTQLDQNNSMYGITNEYSYNFLASTYAMEILSPEKSNEIIRGNGAIRPEDQRIWKYVGQRPDGISKRTSANQASCNWIVYRLAGVLLMKAEALSQIGEYDEALRIVNRIRERALVAHASTQETPHAFEDLILRERAKELAYEGKRWFDLLRMGRRNNYERKDQLIELIIQNVPASQKRVLASKLNDPNGWYFPINAGEIEDNVNLTQNPYYQEYED